MSRSVKVAFCGIMTGGSIAVLFLTGVIPFGRMALAGLAGLLLIAVVTEIGTPWAWSVYVAVSLLAVFVVAYKHAVVAYILVLGCYPILKAVIEKRIKGWCSLALKLVYFNAAALLDFWVAVTLLSVPRSSYRIFGMNLPWLLLLIASAGFLVYDYALSLIAIGYYEKIHPIVRRVFHN